MSTASPIGPGTEAKLAPALDHKAEYDEKRSASTTYIADVEVLIPSDSLSGTRKSASRMSAGQTIRIDDAQATPQHSTLQNEYQAGRQSSQEQQSVAEAIPALTPDGILELETPVSSGAVYLATKRALDVVMSTLLLLLLSPVLLLSALLVKLTDGGAVFYPHTRVGEGGNEFTCYKFRSMVVNADKMKAELAFYNSHDDHRTFKIPNDPRVTWIGRWMRRTSIDELPQLWNVLKGEMSMVGPRPPVVTEVEQYTWGDMQRLVVKPGLTCIWQVSGRSRLPFPEQLQLDLQYIENRSLALDLKLIALTIPAVMSADGAY